MPATREAVWWLLRRRRRKHNHRRGNDQAAFCNQVGDSDGAGLTGSLPAAAWKCAIALRPSPRRYQTRRARVTDLTDRPTCSDHPEIRPPTGDRPPWPRNPYISAGVSRATPAAALLEDDDAAVGEQPQMAPGGRRSDPGRVRRGLRPVRPLVRASVPAGDCRSASP